MTPLLRKVAVVVALTAAVPVWAQAPMSAEELNRLELNRLAAAPAPPVAPLPAFVADPVGLIVADGIRPTPRFPGLLTVVGYGVAAGGTVLDIVLVGGPSQY